MTERFTFTDFELRKKVAIACGWSNLYAYAPLGTSPEGVANMPIPDYETDINVIVAEFEKRDINYVLSKRRNKAMHLRYRAELPTDPASARYWRTAAIALCRLFIAVMENPKIDPDWGRAEQSALERLDDPKSDLVDGKDVIAWIAKLESGEDV